MSDFNCQPTYDGRGRRIFDNCQTRLIVLSAGLLLLAGTSLADVDAPTITAFSATPGGAYSGSEAIYTTFTASHAKISVDGGGNPSYVTCPSTSTSGCGGDAADFLLTITGTSSVLIDITMDGTLDGSTQASGGVLLEGGSIGFVSSPTFFINPPSFDVNILSVNTSINGSTTLAGFLSLSLAAGQTATLPNSYDFNISAVAQSPEPGPIGLIAIGVVTSLLIRRRGSSRTVCRQQGTPDPKRVIPAGETSGLADEARRRDGL
ncbi:MAG: hypothetical protein WBW33_01115 [Bryobacteraceae bacterium]